MGFRSLSPPLLFQMLCQPAPVITSSAPPGSWRRRRGQSSGFSASKPAHRWMEFSRQETSSPELMEKLLPKTRDRKWQPPLIGLKRPKAIFHSLSKKGARSPCSFGLWDLTAKPHRGIVRKPTPSSRALPIKCLKKELCWRTDPRRLHRLGC